MGLIMVAILLPPILWQLQRAARLGVIRGITFDVRRAQAPAAFWANVATAVAMALLLVWIGYRAALGMLAS